VTTFALLTSGTRGDVQPFVALAVALQRAGHEVRLCTHERFRPFVEAHGVPYAFMNDDLLRLAETPQGRALTEGRGNPLKALRTVGPIYAQMLREAERAAAGADVIVHHPKTLAAPSLHEAWGVPSVMVLPVPAMTPTSAFALPLLGDRDLGPFLNRASYAPLAFSTSSFRGVLDPWRRGLGLGPAGRRPPHLHHDGKPVPTLYPVSPHVVPTPPDWPETTLLTGAWHLDTRDELDPELRAFLEAGEAPVVIGFGSMSGGAHTARTAMIVDAVRRSGVRAVLLSGWGGLDEASARAAAGDRLFVARAAPFERLFPQAAAVVHHGGAGTTAEGLRAGLPTLVCPFFGDQGYWGARVASLGVGPAPIPQRRLDARLLATALVRMRDDAAMRQRAAALGRALREEDGLGVAVRTLTALATPPQPAVTTRPRAAGVPPQA
jgi:sterol 3beta-glucosyltransferase